MTDQPEIPAIFETYQSHKVVKAAKIAQVRPSCCGTPALEFEDGSEMHVSEEWFIRHSPHKGGYCIVKDDGYRSFSPADQFERGYDKKAG